MGKNTDRENDIYKTFYEQKNVLCVKRDIDGNILYPDDKEVLQKYMEVLNSSIKSGEQFYHIKSKTWYKLTRVEKQEDGKNIVMDFLEDITALKEAIYDLKIDALTNVLKDRKESDRLIIEYMKYALDNNEAFSLIMADIDMFKVINDTYGHDCGDKVLKNVGKVLLEKTRQSNDKFDHRPSDIIVRVGGDEFLIFLKNISLEDTKEKVKELKENVRNMHINYGGKDIKVTMSFGYCHIGKEFNSKADVEELKDDMSKVADEFLYFNKNERKNINIKQLIKHKEILN